MQVRIIRLHCATSKPSLWNMGYVARGGAFERPHIYRTNIHVYHSEFNACTCYMEIHVYSTPAKEF